MDAARMGGGFFSELVSGGVDSIAGTSVGAWRDLDGPRGSRNRVAQLDGHRPAEGGEEDEPLAHRKTRRLRQATTVELQLRRVVRGLGEGLVRGDRVALVVHDHELAVLLEDEIHDPLHEVWTVGEPERELAPRSRRA